MAVKRIEVKRQYSHWKRIEQKYTLKILTQDSHHTQRSAYRAEDSKTYPKNVFLPEKKIMRNFSLIQTLKDFQVENTWFHFHSSMKFLFKYEVNRSFEISTIRAKGTVKSEVK